MASTSFLLAVLLHTLTPTTQTGGNWCNVSLGSVPLCIVSVNDKYFKNEIQKMTPIM